MALKNRFLSKLFYNKKFVIAFSLISAFLLWLIVTLVENPERQITFSNINITMSMNDQASESGLEVISTSNTTANVTVSGPSYVLSTLTANDISVIAQLNEINESGEFPINLNATCAKSGEIEIVAVSPSKISAVFDYRDTKQFALEVLADGVTCSDNTLTRGNPVVSNAEDATLSITGPRNELLKIARVVAKTDVVEAIAVSKSYDAGIVLYDAESNVIDPALFTFSTDRVNITVPILLERTLPLKASFINVPKAYSEKPINHTISVDKLTVLGPQSVVSEMEYISLSAIDFDTISTQKNTFEVAIELPNGVKCADNVTTVSVSIDTANYMQKTVNIDNFKFDNVPAGLKATAGTVKNVVICGPRNVVSKIKEGNLFATADLSGKTAGKYTVLVRIVANDDSAVWQVGSYEVSVTIQ